MSLGTFPVLFNTFLTNITFVFSSMFKLPVICHLGKAYIFSTEMANSRKGFGMSFFYVVFNVFMSLFTISEWTVLGRN